MKRKILTANTFSIKKSYFIHAFPKHVDDMINRDDTVVEILNVKSALLCK